MKVVKRTILGVIFSGMLLLGLVFILSRTNPRITQITNDLNIFIQDKPVYVKVSNHGRSTGKDNGFTYSQQGVDTSGQSVAVDFYTNHRLKENSYLKLSMKDRYVDGYQAIAAVDVPAKVKSSLNID